MMGGKSIVAFLSGAYSSINQLPLEPYVAPEGREAQPAKLPRDHIPAMSGQSPIKNNHANNIRIVKNSEKPREQGL